MLNRSTSRDFVSWWEVSGVVSGADRSARDIVPCKQTFCSFEPFPCPRFD